MSNNTAENINVPLPGGGSLSFYHQSEEAAAAVDAAAEQALTLVRELSERDPHDPSPENPWKSPDKMLEQLEKARTKVTLAWERLKESFKTDQQQQQEKKSENSDSDAKQAFPEHNVRVAYMDMITDAFADCLEELRQKEGDELDLDILVDCLQSGIDLMSQEDKEFFESSGGNKEADEGSGITTTPHERRRELSFQVEEGV